MAMEYLENLSILGVLIGGVRFRGDRIVRW